MSFLPFKNPTTAPTNVFDENSSRAYNSIGDWITYEDAVQATPVDGIGGSPTVTITRNVLAPLVEPADFALNKPATDCQGQGWSIPFLINKADKGSVMQVQFDYQPGTGFVSAGTGVNSDINVWVYDITNAVLIPLVPYQLTGGTGNPWRYTGYFQPSSNSQQFRLILHVATSNATAWTVNMVSVKIGQEFGVTAPNISDWVESDASGTWNNTTYTSKMRRVGDSMQISVMANLTGAPTGSLVLVMPTGYQIDPAKFPTNFASLENGYAAMNNGAQQYVGSVRYNSPTNLDVAVYGHTQTFIDEPSVVNATVPFTFAAGHSLHALFEVPILGWASNAIVSDTGGAREVSCRVYRDSNQSISNATEVQVQFNLVDFDSHSAWNTSAFNYTFPESGRYQIEGHPLFSPNATGQRAILAQHTKLDLSVQGIDLGCDSLPSGSEASRPTGFTVVDAIAGETLEFRVFQNSGGSLNIDGIGDGRRYLYASINKISSPNLPLPTDTIAARVGLAVSAAVTANTPVIFDTVNFDTHGGYNLSTGAYKIPVSKKYRISITAIGNSAFSSYVYQNGTNVGFLVTAPGANQIVSGTLTLNCLAKDEIQISTDSSITLTGQTPFQTQFSIEAI